MNTQIKENILSNFNNDQSHLIMMRFLTEAIILNILILRIMSSGGNLFHFNKQN